MSKNAGTFLATIVALFFLSACTNVPSPHSLKVSEGFENPLGFYDANPNFSWKLPDDGMVNSQIAYRIVAASSDDLLPDHADIWDSKKQDSEESLWIKYAGKELQSRQKIFWQLKYWDQDGKESEWSELAYFELGLLSNNDWQANWISLPDSDGDVYTPEYLRKEFTVSSEIEEARLYITSKGIFEARINGQKVGEDVMPPGWTPYKKRIETLTYDVSDQIKQGDNAIGILLGEGWFSGRIGYRASQWIKKPYPRTICQLEITFKDGTSKTVLSDNTWKGTDQGPIRFSSIYDGETYDANLELEGWSAPGFDESAWAEVSSEAIGDEFTLVPKRHHTVKSKLELPALTINKIGDGKVVFDLGQNMVGVAQVNIPVKKDQKVTIRFAEMLEKDGTLYTDNYRSAKSTDYYIPNENGVISWKPTFTFHGFRYVELSGFDKGAEPAKDWVTGLVQYSDFEQTGTFATSHDKLNHLQSNVIWGLRGNFFDIPTDCPQRDERLGWTGDAQVFAPTSMFNCDVYSFWASWLQSMREEQREDGSIPVVVPNILTRKASTGWSDAATVIPWEIYFRTGDKNILEENYWMMRGLVDYYLSESENHILSIYTYGDWLQPYPSVEGDRSADTPPDLIGTAYFARSVELTLKAARVLGMDSEVPELEELHNAICLAFDNKFMDEEGKLTTKIETQTGYLLALGFNLIPKEKQDLAIKNLLRKIEDAGGHLRTGFLGTPLLAPVLDKFGHTDVMFEMLFKETYPSWFYSINQGATTMWERWNSYSHKDGFGDASMNSFNHYAYGAIGQWMYERMAGLAPLEPGYKKIQIAPIFESPLSSAKAEYISNYGIISSAWGKTSDGTELSVVIPPNTSAKVIVPINEGEDLFVDGGSIESRKEIKNIVRNEGLISMDVEPGDYSFLLKK